MAAKKKKTEELSMVPATPMDMTLEEEREQKIEVMEEIDNTSLLELRKQNIKSQSEQLSVQVKETNLDIVAGLDEKVSQIVQSITDPEVIDRIMSKMKTGRDYGEMVKALTGIVDLRASLLDKTVDEFAATGKKKRIAVHFQGQGVKVAVGVETDG